MADSSSSASGPISGVAERYASALFDLAVLEKKVPNVEKGLNQLDKMLKDSSDMMALVKSPVFSAHEQSSAIDAILGKAKITGLVGNFVRVVTGNRRLNVLPDILTAFTHKMAEHRGEVTAQVTVAQELTAAQNKELQTTLKGVVGKDVALDVAVDPSLLGGMIVKIGSRQIDTSIKTKLSSLKLVLKEAG